MKKILIAMLLSMAFSWTYSFAQGGSNYSIIGIGDINSNVNATYEGLGGTAIAFPIDHGINYKNPAMWSTVKTTRLQLGYVYNQYMITSDSDELFQNNTQFNGFSTVFSVDTALGASFSLGLYPYSTVNYYIQNPIYKDAGDLILQGKNLFQGDGGLASGYVGGSIKPFDFLAIGISVNAIFGKIYSKTGTMFYGDPYAFDHVIYKDDYFSGFGFKAGIYATPFRNFAIGAFYDAYNDFKVTHEVTYDLPFYQDTTTSEVIYTDMPQSFGIGLSYQYRGYIFGADYSIQDFSGFDFNESADSEFKSSNQLSFGVCRPGEWGYGKNLAEKTTYKAGFSYKSLYYKIRGHEINDINFSFGAAIPIKGTWIVDTGLSLGMRGTTDDGLLREYYSRFSVSFSIGEIWFKPFRR